MKIKKSYSLENLHELAVDNPAKYKEYMEKLPEEYQKKVIENAAQSRYGYKGVKDFAMSLSGGLPGLIGHVAAEAVDAGVRQTTGKDSFGKLLYSGNNPYLQIGAEILNPGNLAGGFGAARDITARPGLLKYDDVGIDELTGAGKKIVKKEDWWKKC